MVNLEEELKIMRCLNHITLTLSLGQVRDLAAEISRQDAVTQKLLSLLDLIAMEDDASLAKNRFDILEEHGEITFGVKISGRKQ